MSLTTKQDQYSYAIGMDVCENLKHQDLDLALAPFLQGFQDVFNGSATLLDEEAKNAALMTLQEALQAKHVERSKAAAGQNLEEGKAFLEQNRAAEGIQVTESGLQYRIIKEGEGPKPRMSDTVVTHYRGTLLDGHEFDSSYRRGEPATFPVGGVIPGWTEALQLMTVGSKWQLFIPSELAYGARGAGQDIAPHSTLVFDIELLEIK